jgi:Cu(I)/Ag(I) efflux system periplasmic protein CusF
MKFTQSPARRGAFAFAGSLLAMALAAAPAAAQSGHSHADHGSGSAAAAAKDMSDAEVRKVDKAQGKLTLRHGPIPNLDMPPMTMVFAVADPAMLDAVKAGDKVKFRAANEGGRFTVVEIAPAQ